MGKDAVIVAEKECEGFLIYHFVKCELNRFRVFGQSGLGCSLVSLESFVLFLFCLWPVESFFFHFRSMQEVRCSRIC